MTILATSHKLTQYSRSSNTMIDMGMEGLKQKKKKMGGDTKGSDVWRSDDGGKKTAASKVEGGVSLSLNQIY